MTLLLTLILNIWIWKILQTNFLLAILIITTTIVLYTATKTLRSCKDGVSARKTASLVPMEGRGVRRSIIKTAKSKPYLLLLLASLLFFQWQTTTKSSLTKLQDTQISIQQKRINVYPRTFVTIGSTTIWLPLAHWFEERKEFTVLTRIQKNMFENLDINQYFFAAHPREPGFGQFEKFPYILLPFFVVGILSLASSTNKLTTLLFFMLPILLSSFYGNNNPLGLFSIFPLFTLAITRGLEASWQKTSNLSTQSKQKILIAATAIFFLVFIQVISYHVH